VTSNKSSSCHFGCHVFSNQSMFGATVAHIFREFAQVFREFAQVFKEFTQIFREFVKVFRDFGF